MRLFIPGVPADQDIESVYEAFREVAHHIAGYIKNGKIYDILYKRNDKLFRVKVGERHPVSDDIVLAIVETTTYYVVFTSKHGIMRCNPYLIRLDETLAIEEFDI